MMGRSHRIIGSGDLVVVSTQWMACGWHDTSIAERLTTIRREEIVIQKNGETGSESEAVHGERAVVCASPAMTIRRPGML